MQSVQLDSTRILTAVTDGRCWLVEVSSRSVTALPLSSLAAERQSLASTLVEGAIAAGIGPAQRSSDATWTLARYVRWLVGNYVFAGQTPGLFREAAIRFEQQGRRDLAAFAAQKAQEEDGHAELAYQDLEGLGLPATTTIRFLQPPSAKIFAEKFRSYVRSEQPVALFGFSYCLERMAIGRDQVFFEKVKAICPPKCRAYRFLKVHSSLGADSTHVHEQLACFEVLESDLDAIVCAVYETAKLLSEQPAMDQALTDDVIVRRLEDEGVQLPVSLRARRDGACLVS